MSWQEEISRKQIGEECYCGVTGIVVFVAYSAEAILKFTMLMENILTIIPIMECLYALIAMEL